MNGWCWSENSREISSTLLFSSCNLFSTPISNFLATYLQQWHQTLAGLHPKLKIASPDLLWTPRYWERPVLVRKQLRNQLSVVVFCGQSLRFFPGDAASNSEYRFASFALDTKVRLGMAGVGQKITAKSALHDSFLLQSPLFYLLQSATT